MPIPVHDLPDETNGFFNLAKARQGQVGRRHAWASSGRMRSRSLRGSQLVEDRAVRPLVAVAAVGQLLAASAASPASPSISPVQLGDVLARERLDVGARRARGLSHSPSSVRDLRSC